jgi:hypothetical protein
VLVDSHSDGLGASRYSQHAAPRCPTARDKQPRKEKQNMNCEYCKRVCPTENFQKLWKFLHRFVCPVGASESEAAQRFASSCGSASAAPNTGVFPSRKLASEIVEALKPRAEGEPHDLSRAVQLPVSELAALAERWQTRSDLAAKLRNGTARGSYSNGRYDAMQMAYRDCAADIDMLIAASAPSAAGASGGS